MLNPQIVKETPCPSCSDYSLSLRTRYSNTQLGSYYLAGQRLNLPIIQEVWLVCYSCGEEAKGNV